MSVMEKIVPYLDEIMAKFYRSMLEHEKMSVFFKSKEDIDSLIAKQKASFIESLSENPDQLKARYLRLGAMHYELRVPSADFLKSTSIWRSCFIDYAINRINSTELVKEVESYFKTVDAWMSKGYLDKQLEVDMMDLKGLITEYEKNEVGSADEALLHLQWLYQILQAIKFSDISLAPELDADKCTVHNVLASIDGNHSRLFSAEHYDDLHHRLHIDAKSLFYYIETNDYLEVLSLYSNLLGVYKITLITLGNLNLQQHVVNLQNKLVEARDEINHLRGIIPICSYCHSIRDDEGAWNRLEKYISEHSEAKFSHGICPKCVEKVKL